MFQLTKNIDFPRQKNYIKGINNLFEGKSIKLPEQQIQEKFTPIFFRSNSATLRSPKKQMPSSVGSARRSQNIPLTVNTVSNKQIHGYTKSANLDTLATNNHNQLRKQKMKAMLSVGNLRKALSNNRKVLTSQNYKYRTTIPGQKRAKTAQKPTHNKANPQIALQSNLFPTTENQSRYSSVEMGLPKNYSNDNYYDYRPPKPEKQTKNYLKKGTSINKSVLNTILRLKLSKNVNQEEDIQKNIKNQEILNMIKVYKGTSIPITAEKQRVLQSVGNPQKTNNYNPLIIGWENETEQYNID